MPLYKSIYKLQHIKPIEGNLVTNPIIKSIPLIGKQLLFNTVSFYGSILRESNVLKLNQKIFSSLSMANCPKLRPKNRKPIEGITSG